MICCEEKNVMPIYTYKCLNKDCQNEFDSVEKINTNLTYCPECGNLSQKIQQIHKTYFRLRGFGWSKHGYDGPSNRPTKGNLEA